MGLTPEQLALRLTTEQLARRKLWLAEVSKLAPAYGITEFASDLMSPHFRLGSWQVAIEHGKAFKTVVFGWRGDPNQKPSARDGWSSTLKADQRKHWHFRVPLGPADLSTLLDQLLQVDTLAGVDAVLENRVAASLADSAETRRDRLRAVPDDKKLPARR